MCSLVFLNEEEEKKSVCFFFYVKSNNEEEETSLLYMFVLCTIVVECSKRTFACFWLNTTMSVVYRNSV